MNEINNDDIKYRKNPLIIEAIQFTGVDSFKDIAKIWSSSDLTYSFDYLYTQRIIIVNKTTPNIPNYALIGDWIIKGIEGEYYSCSDSVFKKTYTKENTNDQT